MSQLHEHHVQSKFKLCNPSVISLAVSRLTSSDLLASSALVDENEIERSRVKVVDLQLFTKHRRWGCENISNCVLSFKENFGKKKPSRHKSIKILNCSTVDVASWEQNGLVSPYRRYNNQFISGESKKE